MHRSNNTNNNHGNQLEHPINHSEHPNNNNNNTVLNIKHFNK